MKIRLFASVVLFILLSIFIPLTFRFYADDEKPKIVVVVKALDREYWRTFKAGAEQAFTEFNINGKVMAPDSPYPFTKQAHLLNDVRKEKLDALIVAPVHPMVIDTALLEYKKQNIPVLLADTDAGWNGKTAYIGTDNIALGRQAGALLSSMMQPGDEVALIAGKLNDPVMSARMKGAREVLEAAGIKIVTEQPGYNELWMLNSVTEEILKTYPHVKGIVAADDLIALDALKIIEQKGLRIPVTGADGTTEMVKLIKRGKLDATVAQNPYDMGYLSVEQALKVINREPFAKRTDSGVDIITRDNANDRLNFLGGVLN